ncbi:MAG: MaoC family dehydratase N-terminal domain-containing protein [Chloroflexi bacterium]|nr:MaoC family dehydratase N-terminal domain-containing protein [Chloroflexota bacterium]MBI4216061.1 MaoC family dehydratase N-terminal domain-containing protein [Chloroflexota bacterium]
MTENERRAWVGRELAPVPYKVSGEHIKEWCQAVGEKNPVYFDARAARAAGYPGQIAPPSYAIMLSTHQVRSLPFGQLLGRDTAPPSMPAQYGEQTFEHHLPLVAGETYTIRGRIASVETKEGRQPFDLVAVESIIEDRHGERAVFSRLGLIFRR